MRLLLIAGMTLALATGAFALTGNYGWEDGVGTVLGTYGNVGGTSNVTTVAHTGARSLEAFESPLGGTPQLYLAWIWGLQDGDAVTATVWCYDTTPGTNPSGRLWGHYTVDHNIDAYGGSASGLYDYSVGDGWTALTYTWVFDGVSDPTRDGLVVEGRIYAGAEFDTVWYDDIEVIAPDGVKIIFPDEEPVGNEPTSWGDVKSLFR